MISKHFCGSAVLCYRNTQDVVAKNPHIDLGSAMAISGAAASTNMGWQSRANLRFWLGLMNIRLGYWLIICCRIMMQSLKPEKIVSGLKDAEGKRAKKKG